MQSNQSNFDFVVTMPFTSLIVKRQVHCIFMHVVVIQPSYLPPWSFCLQEMIDEADRNGDGQIDEEEFYRIMKKTSLF